MVAVVAVTVAVSSAQVVRRQADPDRTAIRAENRKRRGRATHYEGVPVCPRVQDPRDLHVRGLLLTAIVWLLVVVVRGHLGDTRQYA